MLNDKSQRSYLKAKQIGRNLIVVAGVIKWMNWGGIAFNMNNGNQGQSSRRLLEVDFFRGAAILVIFWNHLLLLVQTAGSLSRSPLKIHYGFSDTATVFVFLSGFVSGIVYDKHLVEKGFLKAQLKALRRAGQIYGAQLLTLGILVACSFLWRDKASLDPLHRQLEDFSRHPISETLGLISLQSCLDYVDILPFYIVILVFVPLVLVGFRKKPTLTLLLSASIYISMQVLKALNFNLWMPDWFVNPFAWQFLFILGLYLGFRWRNRSSTIPRSTILAFLAGAVTLFSIFEIPWLQARLRAGIPGLAFIHVVPLAIPWIQKELLEPVVLLHFASVAYLTWMAAPKIQGLLRKSIARPIVISGQHSLFLYCLATILDYVLSHVVVQAGGAAWTFVVAGLTGWCLIVGTPMILWSRLSQERMPSPTQASSASSS